MEDIGHLRGVDQIEGMPSPTRSGPSTAWPPGTPRGGARRWARRVRAHRQPRRRDLQGRAPAGLRGGLGEARRGARRSRRRSSRRRTRAGRPRCPGCSTGLAAEPTTMIHGDFRADNLFFEADGSVAAVDFQLIGTGRGVYDLAYFVTQSLDPRRRLRSTSGRLFDRWTSPPSRRPASRRPTSRRPGTTTARPPCSASCTPWWRGAAWTPAIPARSASPPRCSSASTGRWRSSTSPSCSEAPGGSDGRWRTLANRNQHRAALNPAAVQPDQSAPPPRAVAQLAEQRSPKPQVGGSSPSCPALSPPQEPPRPWR